MEDKTNSIVNEFAKAINQINEELNGTLLDKKFYTYLQYMFDGIYVSAIEVKFYDFTLIRYTFTDSYFYLDSNGEHTFDDNLCQKTIVSRIRNEIERLADRLLEYSASIRSLKKT